MANCSCWLGTGATFGDSDVRKACAVHGEAGGPQPETNRCLWHGDGCSDKTCRDSGRWTGWPRNPNQAVGEAGGPPPDLWRELGDLLQSGGMYDPAFLVGMVRGVMEAHGAVPQWQPQGEKRMEAVMIPSKTVVHIKGIPVYLAVDTIVEVAYNNMSLLTGYHYAHLTDEPTPCPPASTDGGQG